MAAAVTPFPLSPLSALTEADLSDLWENQRFPPGALVTRDGRALRVVYRGRRGAGPGPDFRDAIIAAPDELLSGDVELHTHAAEFRRHGHHEDPAYGGLALHVVFESGGEDWTELWDGRPVPVVALADWTRGRAREIREWLMAPARWREPCATAVPRLGGPAVAGALGRLGDMRFRARTATFSRGLQETPPGQALWEATLEALGYGGERELMRALAAAVPWDRTRRRLLRAAPGARAALAEGALFAALEADRLRPLGPFGHAPRRAVRQDRPSTALPDGPYSRTGSVRPAARVVRPRNRPEARLRGAAALAARFAEKGLPEALPGLVGAAAAEGPAALLRLLTVPGSIGRGRAVEIAANAVLPCAAAMGCERAAEAVYRRLPLPARYGAVRHIARAVEGAVALDARRQQGMLYLLKNYCTQGGCGRCALS